MLACSQHASKHTNKRTNSPRSIDNLEQLDAVRKHLELAYTPGTAQQGHSTEAAPNASSVADGHPAPRNAAEDNQDPKMPHLDDLEAGEAPDLDALAERAAQNAMACMPTANGPVHSLAAASLAPTPAGRTPLADVTNTPSTTDSIRQVVPDEEACRKLPPDGVRRALKKVFCHGVAHGATLAPVSEIRPSAASPGQLAPAATADAANSAQGPAPAQNVHAPAHHDPVQRLFGDEEDDREEGELSGVAEVHPELADTAEVHHELAVTAEGISAGHMLQFFECMPLLFEVEVVHHVAYVRAAECCQPALVYLKRAWETLWLAQINGQSPLDWEVFNKRCPTPELLRQAAEEVAQQAVDDWQLDVNFLDLFFSFEVDQHATYLIALRRANDPGYVARYERLAACADEVAKECAEVRLVLDSNVWLDGECNFLQTVLGIRLWRLVDGRIGGCPVVHMDLFSGWKEPGVLKLQLVDRVQRELDGLKDSHHMARAAIFVLASLTGPLDPDSEILRTSSCRLEDLPLFDVLRTPLLKDTSILQQTYMYTMQGQHMVIVTSDKHLQSRCRALGILGISPGDIISMMQEEGVFIKGCSVISSLQAVTERLRRAIPQDNGGHPLRLYGHDMPDDAWLTRAGSALALWRSQSSVASAGRSGSPPASPTALGGRPGSGSSSVEGTGASAVPRPPSRLAAVSFPPAKAQPAAAAAVSQINIKQAVLYTHSCGSKQSQATVVGIKVRPSGSVHYDLQLQDGDKRASVKIKHLAPLQPQEGQATGRTASLQRRSMATEAPRAGTHSGLQGVEQLRGESGSVAAAAQQRSTSAPPVRPRSRHNTLQPREGGHPAITKPAGKPRSCSAARYRDGR
ncbi:hypothetical protein WJX72_006881 [[Myrmecia] bisecta]|uniref:PIN domain-containing protein n=1 Tax=[Myrmecia] bisecta TaxID=41462 RepID=A0AAW1R7U1_9CHLO